MRSQKGQATLPDLLFATFLFMVLLAGLYYYTQSLQSDASDQLDRRSMDVQASNLAEFIIKNPGTPTNWETLGDTSQIEQIGLAQKDRVLDSGKVVAFVNLGNLDYPTAKSKLQLSAFDFYVVFSGGANLTTGVQPSANKNASVVQRLVTINGVETTVTLTLYEP